MWAYCVTMFMDNNYVCTRMVSVHGTAHKNISTWWVYLHRLKGTKYTQALTMTGRVKNDMKADEVEGQRRIKISRRAIHAILGIPKNCNRLFNEIHPHESGSSMRIYGIMSGDFTAKEFCVWKKRYDQQSMCSKCLASQPLHLHYIVISFLCNVPYAHLQAWQLMLV